MVRQINISMIMVILNAFLACNKVQPTSSLNTAGTAKLCIAGGATLDPQANICVCPQNMEWTGQKCENVDANSAQLTDNQSGTSEKKSGQIQGASLSDPAEEGLSEVEGQEGSVKTKSPTPEKGTTSWVSQFKKSCLKAKATFVDKDHYCICPDSKVLIAGSCRILSGRMIDDVCHRTPRPGKWVQGLCECRPGLVFSPIRGGCVAPLPYASRYSGRSGMPSKEVLLLQKRICENSLNKGLWDPETLDCQCGPGKVFYQELCVEKQKLSSKEICESFGQRGLWSREQKSCQCPIGRLWVNQKCTLYSEVTPQDGCHSNGSGGIWDQNSGSCLCPPGKIWAISGKSCRTVHH